MICNWYTIITAFLCSKNTRSTNFTRAGLILYEKYPTVIAFLDDIVIK